MEYRKYNCELHAHEKKVKYHIDPRKKQFKGRFEDVADSILHHEIVAGAFATVEIESYHTCDK